MPLPITPFNLSGAVGRELEYLTRCLSSGQWAGDGPFSRSVQALFEKKFGFPRSLLTPSCTAALELAALLAEVGDGDEVILPSYTFVSTANPFILRGAKLVFVDSQSRHPNIDAEQIEHLITPRTRVLVIVHYGGVACDMDKILEIVRRHNLFLIEDAAHCIDAKFRDRFLGAFGHLGAFSFHNTKNISCGEGGALVVNDMTLLHRAEILREKGTNRAAFFRGEIDKYGWVDFGSSFLASEFQAAVLLAQLEQVEEVQSKRVAIWERYRQGLDGLARSGRIILPELPIWASQNAHVFFLVTESLETRTRLLAHLKALGIAAAFHYQSLHRSPFFRERHDGRSLANADRFTDCLLRLPLYATLGLDEVDRVVEAIIGFYLG